MLIPRLIRINRDLPAYNYYLDVADDLIKDFCLELKDKQCIRNMDTRLQEIEIALATAKSRYKQEDNPQHMTLVKRTGYLSKKSNTEKKFAHLKNRYAKMKKKKSMGGCIIIPFFKM